MDNKKKKKNVFEKVMCHNKFHVDQEVMLVGFNFSYFGFKLRGFEVEPNTLKTNKKLAPDCTILTIVNPK